MPLRIPLVLVVGALAALTGAASAATTSKPYSVNIAPSPVGAGATVQVTATFQNLTDQQQLGSASLTPPPGFAFNTAAGHAPTVSLPAPARATIESGRLKLLDLAVQPGSPPFTATFWVDAPCVGASPSNWTVVAKQSNNLSGPPGNDLSQVNSSTAMTVTGGCTLAFTSQPRGTDVNTAISGVEHLPGPPWVEVSVLDGNGQPVSTLHTVSIAPGASAGIGTLSGTTSATTVDGVASFATLKISGPGTYRLVASSSGLTSVSSATFQISTQSTQCLAGQPCPPNTLGPLTASADTGTSSGFLSTSLFSRTVAFTPDCPGYDELTGSWGVVLGPDRTKTVTFTISKQEMNALPQNGAAQTEMCFGAPADLPFAAKPGSTAVWDSDGDGFAESNLGLLLDCTVAAPPCVLKRNKDKFGAGSMVISAPAGTIDPAYRP